MPYRWLILLIVSIALFLVVIDMTVLYTALPTLAQALNTSAAEKLWILNAYSLVMAACMPVFGALGDRYGQRRIFVVGLLAFGTASLMAAFASHAWLLIGARALLGIGGAAVIPSTIAMVRLTFTDPKEQALAIGVWASIASGGAAVGPVLGGFLLEHFWWGSVFLINVPIVLAALLATFCYVPRYAGQGHAPIDLLSAAQVMLGMLCVVYGIKELAHSAPHYAYASGALLIGSIALGLFVRRQLQLDYPLVDLTILRIPPIAHGMLVALVVATTLVGFELALTQRLQLVLDKSPLQAGLYILPLSLGAFCAGPLAGLLIGRIGAYGVLFAALALTVISIAGYALWQDSLPYQHLLSLGLCGIGIGAALTASSSLVMSHVPAERAAMAGSVEGMSYEVGGALGVTLFGSLISAIYLQQLRGTDLAHAAGESLDQAHANALLPDSPALLLATAKQAFATGFSLTCAVVAAALALLLITLYLRQRLTRTRPCGK